MQVYHSYSAIGQTTQKNTISSLQYCVLGERLPFSFPTLSSPYESITQANSPRYAVDDPPSPYSLSGKPNETPKSGYTNRFTPFLEISSRAATSSEDSLTMVLFSSILEGVTDLARTELPRATVCG